MTLYRTIVADPPWAYPEGHVKTVATGYSKNRVRDTSARLAPDMKRALPYAQMTVAAIQDIPISRLAAEDARVFLWTTNRYLPDAFNVLTAWGFRYRQTFVWHKADGGPFPASLAPNTAEYLLVATRGNPERSGTLSSVVLRVPAVRSHSVKPEAFLDMIEGVSPGPYLELFARRQRLGWDTWGDEALEHVDLGGAA